MFLDSLSHEDKSSLNDWLFEKIGIMVNPQRNAGHLALKITESGSPIEANLADMGFGYSQILPILVQAWASGYMHKRGRGLNHSESKILVMEQPELHLHPGLQAKLADIFAGIVTSLDTNFSLIIETHSPHIVNRFGELIAQGKIASDQVGVVLVDRKEGVSSLSNVNFDENGYLQDWPFGFFEPGMDDVSSIN